MSPFPIPQETVQQVFGRHPRDVLIPVLDENGEPWFVASDVADVLEYRNAPDMTRILDDDEASTHNLRIPTKNQHG